MTLKAADLILMIQVIDRAATKGMFMGPELYPVGILRQRLQEALDG